MLNPSVEFRIAEDFKRISPSVSSKLPNEDENLEWLFLMQHHGVPTRLLDWSSSILVATFFAVANDPKNDGELWSMFPRELNQYYCFDGLPTNKNRHLRYLANEIFYTNDKRNEEKLKFEQIKPTTPMALLPPLKHPRMTAQQSCFTIHPEPMTGYTIPDLIKEEKFLARYIIPKKLKLEIEKNLIYLGITDRTIFPDLDGLAKTLKQSEKFLGWGQPEPPVFEFWKDAL